MNPAKSTLGAWWRRIAPIARWSRRLILIWGGLVVAVLLFSFARESLKSPASFLAQTAAVLIGLGVLTVTRLVELFSTPLRDVPLGVAIIIALLLIAIAVHWNREGINDG
jgi:NhaP-type Na+/H+ or K+/H+ antiporter